MTQIRPSAPMPMNVGAADDLRSAAQELDVIAARLGVALPNDLRDLLKFACQEMKAQALLLDLRDLLKPACQEMSEGGALNEVDAFIAKHGVTRCPTVALLPTQATISPSAELAGRTDPETTWRKKFIDRSKAGVRNARVARAQAHAEAVKTRKANATP